MHRWRSLSTILIGGLCLLSLSSRAASLFPPGIHWMTARTEHITLYFPRGYESTALRAARIAEAAYARLTRDLGPTVRHIHLILTDHTDFANGFATPIPRPLAVIFLVPPSDFETIGDYDNWLTLVIVHELTHVFHLEDAHGFYRFFRHFFGRNPVLFPNLIAPDWYTEGLAVLEETRHTTGGRACSAETHAILLSEITRPKLPRIETASVVRVSWPGALTAYHMGGAFLTHLSSRIPDENEWWATIRAKNRAFLPFPLNHKEAQAIAASFSKAWKTWLTGLQQTITPPNEPDASHLEVIAQPGYLLRSLRIGPNGPCFALRRPHEYPGIFCYETPDHRLRRLNEAIGVDWFGLAPTGRYLVLSRLDTFHTFYIRSVLESFDLSRHKKRFHRANARFIQPDIDRDGHILAVQLRNHGSRLVRIHPDGATTVLAESPDGLFQQPRWSPDSQRLAVILHRSDGTSCIQIRASNGQLHHEFRCDSDRKIDPAWSPDGAVLYFAADDAGRFNLHRIHLIDNVDRFIEERLIANRYELRSPAPTSHGLYALDYTTRGYRVVRLIRPRWEPVTPSKTNPPATTRACSIRTTPLVPADVTWQKPPKPYSAAPVIRPFTGFPTIEFVNGNARPGLFAIGEHIMGYSGYTARVFYDTGAKTTGYDVLYRFDRWYPTLFFRAARFVDPVPRDRYLLENRFETHLHLPYRRFRWSAALNVGLRYQRFNLLNADRTTRKLGTQWSIPFSLGYNRALFFGKSVSPEDGFTAFAFGNIGINGDRFRTIGGDLRIYLPGLFRHHVTAVRGVYITTEGPEPEILSIGTRSSDLGPVRLFGEDARLIRRGWLINAEYRFPIFEIQLTYGLIPLFLHRISAALFYDRARITNHPLIRQLDPMTPRSETLDAAGAEVRLHFEWPGYVRSVVRVGLAFDPDNTRNHRYYVTLDFPF